MLRGLKRKRQGPRSLALPSLIISQRGRLSLSLALPLADSPDLRQASRPPVLPRLNFRPWSSADPPAMLAVDPPGLRRASLPPAVPVTSRRLTARSSAKEKVGVACLCTQVQNVGFVCIVGGAGSAGESAARFRQPEPAARIDCINKAALGGSVRRSEERRRAYTLQPLRSLRSGSVRLGSLRSTAWI
jgi:hypothetical protein